MNTSTFNGVCQVCLTSALLYLYSHSVEARRSLQLSRGLVLTSSLFNFSCGMRMLGMRVIGAGMRMRMRMRWALIKLDPSSHAAARHFFAIVVDQQEMGQESLLQCRRGEGDGPITKESPIRVIVGGRVEHLGARSKGLPAPHRSVRGVRPSLRRIGRAVHEARA